MRVRRFGKSYAHPLVVLVVLRVPEQQVAIGITAGRSVGNAVQRNRAKRMLREAARTVLPKIEPGLKMILIARKPIREANLTQVQNALSHLLFKDNALREDHGNSAHP